MSSSVSDAVVFVDESVSQLKYFPHVYGVFNSLHMLLSLPLGLFVFTYLLTYLRTCM